MHLLKNYLPSKSDKNLLLDGLNIEKREWYVKEN
jgi:hypothetical protein